jgi:hypothetical protein
MPIVAYAFVPTSVFQANRRLPEVRTGKRTLRLKARRFRYSNFGPGADLRFDGSRIRSMIRPARRLRSVLQGFDP